MSDSETSISTRSSYRETVSTPHCALENGSDLHINEPRHYRAKSTEEENESRDFLLRVAHT